MAINKVIFNSVDFWEDMGATLKSAPKYPMPAEVKELVKVKGATGSLTEATGYFNELELELNFVVLKNFSPIKDFSELKRRINKAFNNITDYRLIFSENSKKYYKVKAVEVGQVTKISEYEAEFDVNFILDPFLYLTNEAPVTSVGSFSYNGDIPNKPAITFTVQGNAQYSINVNGQSLTFWGRQNRKVEINTNPYSVVLLDGTPVESTGNAPILNPGSNNISISGGSYTNLKIIKNERYLG